jgi:rhodanese-related sulfurtransferase
MDRDLTPREVADLHARAAIDLIDVREAHEWDAGRIGGARHIPLSKLTDQADTIARERPVVFYCRSGARSAMAMEAFAGAGFDAHNMTGGLLEWAHAGLPLWPENGRVE